MPHSVDDFLADNRKDFQNFWVLYCLL